MPRRAQAPQRLLTTVLFTDIVASTQRAAEVGDKRWRQIVSGHHALVRQRLRQHRGREIDTSGDGFFATFDQPADAIRCAEEIVRDVRRLDIEVRAGIHMGEVEVIGPKVGGIAVHIAARVMSKAGPGQIFVSSTIRDLMSGSDMRFDDLGSHELKGVPAQWHLYAVQTPEAPAEEEPLVAVTDLAPGRRRFPVSLAVVAALLALALLLVAILTLTGGQPSLPRPDLNTVAQIDPAGPKVLGSIEVGRNPLAITADSGRVWVANFDDGTIQSIDTSSNASAPAIALGFSAAPNAITVGGGYVWVISSTTGFLYRLDPTESHGITQTRLGVGIAGVAYGAGAIWVTNNDQDTLMRIDPQNLGGPPSVAHLPSGAGPKGVAFGAGAAWVAEGLRGGVARVDPQTMRVTAIVPLLKGNPNGVAFGEGRIWVTNTEDDSVTRIDPGSNQGTTISGVGNGPVGIAVGDGAAWVANTLDGTVAEIDSKTGRTTHIDLGSGFSPNGVAVTPGAVWVCLGRR